MTRTFRLPFFHPVFLGNGKELLPIVNYEPVTRLFIGITSSFGNFISMFFFLFPQLSPKFYFLKCLSSLVNPKVTANNFREEEKKCQMPQKKPIDTIHLGFTGHIFETLGTELVLFSVIFDAISLLNFISLFSRLPSFVSVFFYFLQFIALI